MSHFLLERYIENHSYPLPPIFEWLERESNLRTKYGRMLAGPTVARFLITFSKLLSPDKILEIGSFTGYSALALAEGLSPSGTITMLEVNEELESLILEALERGEVAERANLIIGDALTSLDKMAFEEEPPFDLVYIDANKREYSLYYSKVLPLVRNGGYIIADNVLWNGRVVGDEQRRDRQGEEIIRFNQLVKGDHRVESYILPLRDGLTIIRKL